MDKIILIAPSYFNYYNLIIETLKSNGYSVDFIEDESSGFLYTFSSKFNFLLNKYKFKYRKKVLKILNEKSYDYLLVISGRTLDFDFWEYVSINFSFKKVLYQWDSLRNFNYERMIPFFDKVVTFDRLDSKKLNISYLPLFYKQEKAQINIKQDIDLLFIGTWHSDRIEILNKIAQFAEDNGLKYYFKLYYPWYGYIYRVHIKKTLSKSKFFIFKPIPLNVIIDYYHKSKCIIDINHPWQSGLTMRTIETIGKGKKLITTNPYIKAETFYDKRMIQVIDRKNIIIDSDFLENKVSYKNIEKLEISNWIYELLH